MDTEALQANLLALKKLLVDLIAVRTYYAMRITKVLLDASSRHYLKKLLMLMLKDSLNPFPTYAIMYSLDFLLH
ncbi:hypothetical protein Droror1_Dr00025881 [Drosera rotundifolia]